MPLSARGFVINEAQFRVYEPRKCQTRYLHETLENRGRKPPFMTYCGVTGSAEAADFTIPPVANQRRADIFFRPQKESSARRHGPIIICSLPNFISLGHLDLANCSPRGPRNPRGHLNHYFAEKSRQDSFSARLSANQRPPNERIFSRIYSPAIYIIQFWIN